MKRIIFIPVLLISISSSAQTTFMHAIYHPSLVVDLIAGAQNDSINCFVGRHGDILNDFAGKIYACDQNGNTLFQRLHQQPGYNIIYNDICKSSSGGFISAGYRVPVSGNSSEPVISSIDASGTVYSITGFSNGYNMHSIPHLIAGDDSSSYVCFSNYTSGNNSDIFLIHSRNGIILNQWIIKTDSLALPLFEYIHAIHRNTFGAFYLLGTRETSPNVFQHYFLCKLDSLLRQEWTIEFADTSYRFSNFSCTSDGGVLLFGAKRNSTGENEPFISKLDSSGIIIRTMVYSSSMINYLPVSVTSTQDDAATLIGVEVYSSQLYLTTSRIHIDSLGQVVFASRIYGAQIDFEPFHSFTSDDSNMWISGRNGLGTQGMIMKLNPGEMAPCYDSSLSVTEYSEILPINFISAAIDTGNMTAANLSFNIDSSLFKTVVCFTTTIADIPNKDGIQIINPVVNELTLFNVNIYTQIAMYDLTGRNVLLMEKGEENNFKIDVQQLQVGCYLIRLNGKEKQVVMKIVKL